VKEVLENGRMKGLEGSGRIILKLIFWRKSSEDKK
jgi:hypothetical protein